MMTLAFGSLVGKEAKDVGVANAGLHDQEYPKFDVFVRLTFRCQNVKP